MDQINKVKSISIWIFIVPFIAINLCLILITQFQGLFPNHEDIIHNTIPYFDGGASISRVARPFPSWLIFKPAMFLTSFLLIRYWLHTKEIIKSFDQHHKHIKKILFFGIGSAVCLTIHSIFLGIKIDHDLYKFLRRVVMLSFIIFELVAQAYLISTYLELKEKLKIVINQKILKIKKNLITVLIIASIIAIPFLPFTNFKFLKHALEWNLFLGVITFYLLTFFMWKKK